MRPVLKYNGGKWIDGPWIISHFPEHRIYGELFGGGASVLLQKPRAKIEYYNDLDSQVYTFFLVLRQRPNDLIRAIRYTPYSREFFEREVCEPADDELEAALRFAARCWMGRTNNRLSRTSFRRAGNLYVPGGYIPAKLWSDLRGYIEAARRLRGVVIENCDWHDLALQLDGPETLLYIDPPYWRGVRKAGRMYDVDMMSTLQHARMLRKIRALKSMIIISGYDSALYRRLLPGYTVVTKTSTDDARNTRTEALFISPNGVKQRDLFSANNLFEERAS